MKAVHRRFIRASVLAALMLGLGATAQGGIYDAWTRTNKITFAGYNKSGTLTNFPVLVLVNTSNGFYYSQFAAATNGGDLRFSDSNGTTALNFEIEKWDTNGNSYVWVQVPTISSTSDFFYAYWNGTNTTLPPCVTNGATWTNTYGAVWHMTNTNARDGTSNGNNGTSYGGVSSSTGIVGDTCSLDGSSSPGTYVSVNDSPSLRPAQFTISFWAKRRSASGTAVCKRGHVTEVTYKSYLVSLSTNVYVELATTGNAYPNWITTDGAVTSNEWRHINVTFAPLNGNSSDTAIYVDGVKRAATFNGAGGYGAGNKTLAYVNQPVNFGRNYASATPGGYLNGNLDEVRIESVARSSNWIWACWANQVTNSTFLNYQGPSIYQQYLAVEAQAATGITASAATLNGAITGTNSAGNADVYFCWGYTNAGSNSLSDWAHSGLSATNWGLGSTFSTNLTGLFSGSSYVFRCFASNTAGTAWSEAQNFTTIYLPAVTNLGSLDFRGYNLLRGRITDTGGDTPYVWFYYWSASDPTSTVPMSVQSGTFSNQVQGLVPYRTYSYSILASNLAGSTWSTASNFTCLPNVFYVATNGNNGVATNWFTACTNLQVALDAAGSNCTIYLAGQAFMLPSQLNWTNRAAGVTIQGGYAGTNIGTSPGARDPSTWPTVLQRAASVSNRILAVVGITNGLLDGVTLKNGWCASTTQNGIGLYVDSCTGLTVVSCVITGNQNVSSSGYGGAGVYVAGSAVLMTNCVVVGNTAGGSGNATVYGGGIFLASGNLTVEDSVIRNCMAQGQSSGYGWGGGIHVAGGSLTLRRSVLRNNASTSTFGTPYRGYGGGLSCNGGTATLQNCLIVTNLSTSVTASLKAGDGIYSESTVNLLNCTVANNSGEGIRRGAGTLTVTNSILWGNGDDLTGTVSVGYCNIQTADTFWTNGVNGCISTNPLFADTTYFHEQSMGGNYTDGYFSGGGWGTSLSNSPCLDTGDPNSAYDNEPTPNGRQINMGAYGNTSVASKSKIAGTVFVIR
jgi:hypothetical protein